MLGDAQNVGGVEPLGTLLALEFHRLALVESFVPILLDRGKVYEDIFSG